MSSLHQIFVLHGSHSHDHRIPLAIRLKLTRAQLCHKQFVETYDPTIEDSYRKQVQIAGRSYMLEILDTAGQEEYGSLMDQWIARQDAYIIVYSITSRTSFDKVNKFIQKIYQLHHAVNPLDANPSPEALAEDSGKPTIPIAIVANKMDREGDREVSREEGERLAQALHDKAKHLSPKCLFFETSAKNATGIEKAFTDTVLEVRRQQQADNKTIFSGLSPTSETSGKPVFKRKLSKSCVLM